MMRKKMLSILAAIGLVVSGLVFGIAGPASAAGNQTLDFNVDCVGYTVAGVWVVDSTNNARSGWVNSISRSGNTAHVTYTGTNAGDHWGVNVGCGNINGDNSQWRYSLSSFNGSITTTTSTSPYIFCEIGWVPSAGGIDSCWFN